LSLEQDFDAAFATRLALREKQIQQNYRPIIGVHKWFARRPGTVFRALLLAEYNGSEPLESAFWKAHQLRGVVADPFMGGGTPIYEANRLGFHVVGTDVNPMAHWVVRQSLDRLDIDAFKTAAAEAIAVVEKQLGPLYSTKCLKCSQPATAKYFLWVKTADCPACGTQNDLFPGYLVAEAERHPKHVVVCGSCGALNEYESQPRRGHPQPCSDCSAPVTVDGRVHRQHVECRACSTSFRFLPKDPQQPLAHRMFGIEYHCAGCKPTHEGRFFKKPDAADAAHFRSAERKLAAAPDLPIPADPIPAGDESNRLHRWGYRQYRQMFNDRQLLGLGTLLAQLLREPRAELRHALLTVFSDFLRYQNLLCRYDTYALKCQDIFSVHGFPVGLVQCENNLLGVEKIGSGSYRHFVAKYARAKEYCREPFETMQSGKQKKIVPIHGEEIKATFVDQFPKGKERQARLLAAPAVMMDLRPSSLDGVFTDPPYYDNVQYAELMDFCFVWLRLGLRDEFPAFRRGSTRTNDELTGNETEGRGMDHFTEGLSAVFTHFAKALKPGAPFVFTYHHNDPLAYLPLVVAILDAGLDCTATLPAAAEMSASLHIAGTGSSVLDSVFVCRPVQKKKGGTQPSLPMHLARECEAVLRRDAVAMTSGGLTISLGDLRCLTAGHVARYAINLLAPGWKGASPLAERMRLGTAALDQVAKKVAPDALADRVLAAFEPLARTARASR